MNFKKENEWKEGGQKEEIGHRYVCTFLFNYVSKFGTVTQFTPYNLKVFHSRAKG